MREALHGGRVWELARELGCDPASILDFSANLNPLGTPGSVLEVLRAALPSALAAYPDQEAPRLKKVLCERHGTDNRHLVLGAGGAALLHLALRAVRPRRVLVPIPCFLEQPRAITGCGAELIPSPMPELHLDLETLDPSRFGCDAVLLTNPHNPTGQMLSRKILAAWIEHHPSVAVIVDEAFMDFSPEETLLPDILERPSTVILRSLTKFYAMPGLRIGYAFAHADLAARMAEAQESWPVGQLELLAAEAALRDDDFEDRSLAFFHRESPRFRQALESAGFLVHPNAAPFFLVEHPGKSCAAMASALARQGLLVRTCSEWPGLGPSFLRFALRPERDQQRLLHALREGS